MTKTKTSKASKTFALNAVQVETLLAVAGATKYDEYATTAKVADFALGEVVTVDALGKRLKRLNEAGYVVFNKKRRFTTGVKGSAWQAPYEWRLSAKGKKAVGN